MRSSHKIFIAVGALLIVGALWLGLNRLTPVVVAVTPPDGADSVYPDASIAVSFSRPMAAETVNNGTIQLRKSDGSIVPAELSYAAERRTVQVKPMSRLLPGAGYELRINGNPASRLHSTLGLPVADGLTARFTTVAPLDPPARPDAPILLVTDESNPYGNYYAEILRAEGFNLFSTVKASALTSESLTPADIVILTASPRNPGTVDLLDRWVRSGGNLIAMRPEGEFLSLFGLADAGTPVSKPYLLANAALPPGSGITHETLQLRVAASRFALQDGVAVAQLFETATQPLANPAVTLRKVGLGHAAAFAYDLAQSVIRTRQGNPEWINQERDGIPPRRTNDLFFPDDIDMTKVGIPQADEQQRLFANLILTMNEDRRPLPRFWYLPAGRRAAIIMAGDDHATKHGTLDSFAQLAAASPPGCRVDAWECYRATSYVTVRTPITPEKARPYTSAGFELGIHVDTGCTDQDNATVGLDLSEQIKGFGKQRMGIDKQETHRMHCVVWNGWADTAKSQRTVGIRMSLDYYYWPGSWIKDRPGYMIGSGFPMRFADMDGTVLDIYQEASHLVNENGLDHAKSIRFLIDRALGPEQYFGAFGTHYDYTDDFFKTLLSVAKERGVALISAAQMLHWLDGRANSRFDNITWNGRSLGFSVVIGEGGNSMVAMLPLTASGQRISSVSCSGTSVPFEAETIKGLEYASFPVKSGDCLATYGGRKSSGVQPGFHLE